MIGNFITKHWSPVFLITLSLSLLLMIISLFATKQTRFRRSLPLGATEIREHYVDLFVDHEYYLSSRISYDEFLSYVENLSCKHVEGVGIGNDFLISGRKSPPWWPKIANTDDVYESRQNQLTVRLVYFEGKLFLLAYTK